MNALALELEGTWEEVAIHAPELAGRRVRMTVLPVEKTSHSQASAAAHFSIAGSLLKFAGTWEDNDLWECLDVVSKLETKPCSSTVPTIRPKAEMYLLDTNHCSLLMEEEAAVQQKKRNPPIDKTRKRG